MTQFKKGTETDQKKCPACEQPILLPSIQSIVGSMEDKCPWCNKILHVKSNGDISVKDSKAKK